MTVIDKRQAIQSYVEHASEPILNALSAVIKAYESKENEDPISKITKIKDLPVELQKEIELGIKDLDEGRTSTHEEVMERMKAKHEL